MCYTIATISKGDIPIMTKQFYLNNAEAINSLGMDCKIIYEENCDCEKRCSLYAACLYRTYNDDSGFEREK